MRTDTIVASVILVCVLSVSGCAQFQDKFKRKPKEEETTLQYQSVREYDVKPNLDLYTKRYIFWKSWHKEVLEVLMDANNKKKKVAIEQAISNLYDMKRMLADEKAEGLGALIVEMRDVGTEINKRVTMANQVRIRKKLESLGRKIKRDYSYNKVRGDIRSEFGKL